MKKINKNTGITLVALVVTIIILLILAGITIWQLTGNGLFEKAKLAKEKQENAQAEEDTTLADYENKLGEYVDGTREQITVDKEEYEKLKEDVANLKTQNTMSGTEHFKGEYYFNGKPIYEKTFLIKLPNATANNYNHNIQNVDQIWCDYSKCYATNGNSNIPLAYPSPSDVIYSISITQITNTYFRLGTKYNYSSYSAYITLNYTKTTDTGDDTILEETKASS